MIASSPPLRLASRAANAHKGNFGKVLLVGGSRGMTGAISLSSVSALYTGSGLVSAAIPDRCLESVAAFHPGIMTISLPDTREGQFCTLACPALPNMRAFHAVGCGPGMSTGPGATHLVEHLTNLRFVKSLVLDADALNCLASISRDDWNWGIRDIVLTPHPGEFERLSGVRASDRTAQIEAATQFARRHHATVVLKGGPTIIAGPTETWTNPTGNPGMATAGSGDILTGVITSLLGQGLAAWEAAKLGVWIHGTAGDLAAAKHGHAGMTCKEIMESLPKAVQLASD